jgi:tetratricopeptide (TPR) repeat protein
VEERYIDEIASRISNLLNNADKTADADRARVLLLDEITRMLDEAAAPTDLQTAFAAGLLHWTRCQLLPEDEGRADFQAALALLAPAFELAPEIVPEPLRDIYRSAREPADDLEWVRDADRLRETVRGGRRQLLSVSPDHPHYATYAAEHAMRLSLIFEQTGDVAALNEAERTARDAVAAAPPAGPGRARCQMALGHILQISASLMGDLETLREAARNGREAVDHVPVGYPARPICLCDLATTLRALFERTGELNHLHEAVRLGRDAIAAAESDAAVRVACLVDLGATLQRVFEWTGDLECLREAVNLCRDAVDNSAPDDLYYVSRLHTLGNGLGMLSEQTGDLGAAREAVDVLRRALTGFPPGHPNRAPCLTGIGSTLKSLFEKTGDVETLREAIRFSREAVAATQPGHPNHAACLANLAASLERLADRTQDAGPLTEAENLLRRSLDTTPHDHPDRGARLSCLGSVLQKLGQNGDLLFEEAASSALAPPRIRLFASRARGRSAMLASDASAALAAFEQAVDLLPMLSPRTLVRADREHGLSEAAGLAASAASAAIQAGRQDRAVELLEQTRCVMLAETMDARGDLADLQAVAPDLAEEFVRLRDELDAIDSAPQAAERRQQLAREWEGLVARIREVNGFKGFLLPPSVADLRLQAQDGPIVIVNPSDYRCDALILTADADRPVKVVELPGLTREDVIVQARRLGVAVALASGSTGQRVKGHEEVHAVLGWLWDKVTAPILDELGFTGPARTWARIWWCPVGEMAFLPLHAAGHHDRKQGATVMDRVMSSYTPTIRALRYARQGCEGRSGAGALIVAMPQTPGNAAADLPGADSEAQRLAVLMPGSYLLTGADATHDAVLAALPHHRIAHLACHGINDWNNPAASRLLLHDHETTPLTVTALSRLRLADADLAYLSACSTTISNQRLADQAVHVTAAFQLAGYKHVIGTLWPIDDSIAARVTDDVYTHLTAKGRASPDTEQTSVALHHAIRRLRYDYLASPTLWAAHIHVGI